MVPITSGGGGGSDQASEWKIPKPGIGLRGPQSWGARVAPVHRVGGVRGRRRSPVEDELGHRSWRELRSEGWHGRRGVDVIGLERGGTVRGGVGVAGRRGRRGLQHIVWMVAPAWANAAASTMGGNERIRTCTMGGVYAGGIGFPIHDNLN
jgi:hypothetical protein